MSDARARPRVSHTRPCQLLRADQTRIPATLINASMSGFLVRSDVSLDSHETIHVCIPLNGETDVTCSATVVRQKDSAYYGLSIQRILPEPSQSLFRLLRAQGLSLQGADLDKAKKNYQTIDERMC